MMYKIVAQTDPYNGNRDKGFKLNEKGTLAVKTIEQGLSLDEARKRLLNLFCQDAGQYFPNWGVACAWKHGGSLYACPTESDGMRRYRDDVFDVCIISDN